MYNESANDMVMPSAAEPVAPREAQLPPPANLWRRVQILAAALMCTMGVASAIYFLRPVDVTGQQGPTTPGKEQAKPLFVGWPRPDLAMVISAQQHGYIQRCGCSDPQLGGLTRRYNFIQFLKAKGWPVVGVDVGEVAQSHGPQATLKYTYSMRALQLMDYQVVGLGKPEFNKPLAKALGVFAINNATPAVIATNLLDPRKDFEPLGLQRYKILDTKPQLGFFNVVDAKVAHEINDPAVKFAAAAQSLVEAMKNKRASINVLIYQGTDDNKEIGNFLAAYNSLRGKNIPELAIVLCLTADSEPPLRTKAVGNTTIVSVGWKGRYVGVLGMYPDPATKGYNLKYELVAMGDQFEKPADPALLANHPVMNLWEEYAKEVERDEYIKKFKPSPHPIQNDLKNKGLNINYAGSDACKVCHMKAYDTWQNSHHGQAFNALVMKAKNPSRRQFDGECVVCHTVGFQHTGGYMAPGNPPNLNASLTNVGCESCHGPGAAHVANPKDAEIRALMNQLSTTQRIPPKADIQAYQKTQFQKQDSFCQKCHDDQNDVHWINHTYQAAWSKIQHYNIQQPAPPGGIQIDAVPPRSTGTPPGSK